jgi:hypothetical protein
MTSSRHIQLPILNVHGPTAVESLPVEPSGDGTYRLLASPGMVEGLAAGDVLALDAAKPTGYRVIERGGNLCVWFFFAAPGDNRGPAASRLREDVERIGGHLDGDGHASVVFTIPMTAGFPAIEAIMLAAEKRNAGSSWQFANVYDPVDGKTPLNWWRQTH